MMSLRQQKKREQRLQLPHGPGEKCRESKECSNIRLFRFRFFGHNKPHDRLLLEHIVFNAEPIEIKQVGELPGVREKVGEILIDNVNRPPVLRVSDGVRDGHGFAAQWKDFGNRDLREQTLQNRKIQVLLINVLHKKFYVIE